ncbi:MAG: undecaprenyldiphospho-muramoylpentapeptide beta-N-acetylglucosaminyltransferase [bacterium]
MKVIFACGGTGGHIYPAIAMAEELLKQDKKASILFVGSIKGMEKEIVTKRGFDFVGVNVRPYIRKFTFKNIINSYFVIKSFFEAASIIKEVKPDIVIGTGGFASYPAVFMAAIAGKKTLIHEPNVVPGFANKILSYFVTHITAGFEETVKYFPVGKVTVTGNPLRESLLKNRRKEGLKKFKLKSGHKTVLIMPGSRAAKSINRVFGEVLPRAAVELKGVQFIWMTGSDEYETAVKIASQNKKVTCCVLRFIDDAGLAYSAADVGILRAGAGTLTELEAVGLPSLIVPYPYATGNHQEKNAAALKDRGAAIVIKDKELNADVFIQAVKKLLDSKTGLSMKKELKKMYCGHSAENIIKIARRKNG